MTLDGFLLARIAEDEEAARAATPSPWVDDGDGYVTTPEQPRLNLYGGLWDCEGASSLCMDVPTAAHVARHDPARVLAECEAKRRIVEREVGSRTKITYRRMMVLQDLASVYADHPDYDEAWRP